MQLVEKATIEKEAEAEIPVFSYSYSSYPDEYYIGSYAKAPKKFVCIYLLRYEIVDTLTN